MKILVGSTFPECVCSADPLQSFKLGATAQQRIQPHSWDRPPGRIWARCGHQRGTRKEAVHFHLAVYPRDGQGGVCREPDRLPTSSRLARKSSPQSIERRQQQVAEALVGGEQTREQESYALRRSEEFVLRSRSWYDNVIFASIRYLSSACLQSL